MSVKEKEGASDRPSNTPPHSLDFISSMEEMPDFVEPFTDKCKLCGRLLLDPFQTRCGHRLCRNCLTDHLTKHGDPTMCPYHEEDCEIISLKSNDGSVYPDFYLLKQLKHKKVYCKFKDNGCNEVIQLGKLQSHIQQCEFGRLPCPNAGNGCEERLKSDLMEEHIKTCNFRPVGCSHCGLLIPLGLMLTHEGECQMMKISCPNNCGQSDIIRREIPDHLEICPLKPINCVFRKMGCNFEGTDTAVKEHEASEQPAHLKMLHDYVIRLETKVDDINIQIQNMPANIASSVDDIQNNLRKHEQKLTRQENRIKETQKTVAKQAQTLLDMRVEESASVPTTNNTNMNEQLSDTLTRISLLETAQVNMRGAMQRLEEQVHSQSAKRAEYDLRFQVLETASYNGVLLWKIKDYKRRKEDAKNGGVLSLYSQAFYTSRHGYRMCARVYLNGDGMGAGTHLSLFFVLMRGEYDALLKWPFRQKVSLMLMDQVGHTRHIRDTFRPDPSSSSFQQPRTEMNIASGCPLFVAHAVLEAHDSPYLKDDTIFIKVICDREGLPTE